MNNQTTLNLIMIAAFALLMGFLLFRYFKTKGKIEIQDRKWGASRISMIVIALLCVVMLINPEGNSALDYLRTVVAVGTCIVYVILHDGIGKEGFVATGTFTSWKDTQAWDYVHESKGAIRIYFQSTETTKKGKDQITSSILFDQENAEKALKFMQENQKKLYRRMRKGG